MTTQQRVGRGARGHHLLADSVRIAGAAAGVVAAHTAGFVASFPDPSRRGLVLATTGHHQWRLFVIAGSAAAVMAAVTAIARGAAAALDRSAAPAYRPGEILLLQVGLYAGLEMIERLAAGHSPAFLLGERAFLIGLILQVVTALLVCWSLGALHRTGHRVVTVLAHRRRPVRPPRAVWPTSLECWISRSAHAGQMRPRGPPVVASGFRE